MKLRNIRLAIKNGQVLEAILWRLGKLGISLDPYFIIQEGNFFEESDLLPPDSSDIECSFLDRDEIESVDFQYSDIYELNRRLDHGDLCFALRKKGELIAYMWTDFKEFNHAHYRFELQENEVYLYDAWVNPDYRGRGIAPYLRARLYEALKNYSKDTFLSCSYYANTPAVRFKRKLGARFLKLYIYIDLWNKYSCNWLLRNYYPQQIDTRYTPDQGHE